MSSLIDEISHLRTAAGTPVLPLHVADRFVRDEEILLAHSKEMLDAFHGLENGKLDFAHFPACADVDKARVSALAARAASGCVLSLIDLLQSPSASSCAQPSLSSQPSSSTLAALSTIASLSLSSNMTLRRAIALVRPPGHHCTRTQSSGNGMLNNVAIAALYAVQKLNKRVLIVDIDIHLSGGTSDCVRGVDTILLVDVFGARGQELRARARAEGRNWRVKETFDNTIALNVSLLHSQAGDQVYESAQVCGEICAAATAHKPGVCFFF